MTRQAPRNNDHAPCPNYGRERLGVDASPFTPESLHIGARQLQVGTGWVATFAVIGYPREVGPGWLAPLLGYPGRVDVSVHIEPVDPAIAAARLRSQLAKLESGRRPAWRRTRPLARPARRGRHRRRLRPVRAGRTLPRRLAVADHRSAGL